MIDIILISSHQLFPGCLVNVRVIGGIETVDEHGQDDKILCVLDSKVDKEYQHINCYQDIPKQTLDQIIYFLSHYKDNDGKKFIKIGNIYNTEKAMEFIKNSKK